MTKEQIAELVRNENQAREVNAEHRAKQLIAGIIQQQAAIAAANKAIASYRKELSELSFEEVKVSDITGE